MNEWNDGYIVEGCDRVHLITNMLEDCLKEHPAIVKAKCVSKIEDCIKVLNQCYQDVGRLDITD